MAETLCNTATADELATLKADLEQKLGKCLLELQRYELLMKSIASDHGVSARVDEIEANSARQRAKFERKTLGEIVCYIVGGYVAAENTEARDLSDIGADDGGSFLSMRVQMNFSNDEFGLIKARLKEFVALRNTLIHHFLATHDLMSVAGCHAALELLETASIQINQHITEAKSWLNDLIEAKKVAAEVLRSDAFAAMLDEQMKTFDT